MARLTRSRRTAAKSEASDAVSDPETAPPSEKRTRRSRKQESKAVKESEAPPPPPIEEEPETVPEQKSEPEPAPRETEEAPAAPPVPEVSQAAAEVTETKPKKIEVEEEKLDFEVEDELQLKAQKDADIEEDTDETSKDQVSPPAADAGEEKLTVLDEMLKKRASRRHSSAVDKENRKDRWGKLVEKAPVNDSRTQVVVTTDSLKELSAELQKEQSRKRSVDEGASKDPVQSVVDAKAPEDSQEKPVEDNSREDSERKDKDDELNQKRKARHISMGDDNSNKNAPTDSAQKSNAEMRKAPTAGMALGTTNWDDLENHRRKPREEATPPKEQPSVHLLVNNLVRPFTLAQLTDFISHGNERVLTDLWLDKIKSKAIATFEASEMSERAREELHNLVWPKGSPKTIKCEFLTAEQVEETKNPSEVKPSKTVGREEKKEPRIEVKEEVSASRDRSENGSGKAEGDDLRRTLDNHKDKDRLTEDRHHRHNRQERDESPPLKKIREWDRPKIQAQQKRLKEEQQPPTPKEEPVKKDVDDSPCLESFFKKTSAMPPLYWLPLNEEQAIERAKNREAKQKEDDRQKLRQLRKNRRF